MNLGGYNGGGSHAFEIMLLLFIFIGPYWLLWLQIRAFRYSEAQSGLTLVMLVLLGLPACYCAWNASNLALIPFWFVGFQMRLMQIAVVALPFTVAWEVYKRGWFRAMMKSKTKKRKKARLKHDAGIWL